MPNYCQNLWSKYAELRAAQAQVEVDFNLAGETGDLNMAIRAIDSLDTLINEMKLVWGDTFVEIGDQNLLKSDYHIMLQLGFQNTSDLDHFLERTNAIQSCRIQQIKLMRLPVRDISSLSGLDEVRVLMLHGTQVNNKGIKPINSFKKLSHLDLADTKISDIELLCHQTSLKNLIISNTSVRDLSPLLKLTNLNFLNIQGIPALGDQKQREIIDTLMAEGVKVIE